MWLVAGGAELRAVGVDLSFAPVVDLDYAVSEIIGDRALHRNPDVVSALAVAMHERHARGRHGVGSEALPGSRGGRR